MSICRIKQEEIFASGAGNDTLNPANAPTAANLEEDLDYIRSVLNTFFGTGNWYTPPTGNFTEVMDGFPIQHYTASDDPAKEGYHKDIIADSISIPNGNLSMTGDFSVTGDFSMTSGAFAIASATSVSVISNSFFISGADYHSFTSNNGDFEVTFSNAGDSFSIWGVGGVRRFQVLEEGKIVFTANQTAQTELINFGGGYSLYQDNQGPDGSSGGTRVWLDGPNHSSSAHSGVVIGPRGGSDYFSSIRLKGNSVSVEGPTTLSINSTNDALVADHVPFETRDASDNGMHIQMQGGGGFSIAPIQSGSVRSETLTYTGVDHNWTINTSTDMKVKSIANNRYLNISVNPTSVSFGTDSGHFYFDRDIKMNGRLTFQQLSGTKAYRIYMGSSFPGTPQDGDIWFKV